MRKHIFRLSLFVVLLALGGSIPGQGSGIHWDFDENPRRFLQGDLRLCLLRSLNFDWAERKCNLEGVQGLEW